MKHKPISAALLALFSSSVALAPAAFAAKNPGDPRGVGDPRFIPQSSEPACNSLTLAATGGPTINDPKTLLIRWFGYTNYELVYGDKIILLDQGYYNRAGTQYKDLGFQAADVKRADLILIGHAHADHISDTAQVGAQTGAPIIGAPITIAALQPQPVPSSQLVSVTGTSGEVLHFPDIGITVQPILGRHGQPPSFVGAFGTRV